METSLDRKLARCAREIEAAKPKGLSFEEFESRMLLLHAHNGTFHTVTAENSRQIKGAAQASNSAEKVATARLLPVAAPPLSVPEAATEKPKFKVGDRVRWTRTHENASKWQDCTVQALDGIWLDVINGRGVEGCIGTADAELLPPAPTPASSEWVEWHGGECPIPKADVGEWMRRNRDGGESTAQYPANMSSRWTHSDHKADIVAYRVVKQP